MISGKVNSISKHLREKYSKKQLAYPRVDNDYHVSGGYNRYPHPVLANSFPLKKKEYDYTKKTSLLELSNNNLLSPSLVFRANGVHYFIDKYFKEDMSIKKNKLEEVTRILNNFRLFLLELEISESYLDEKISVEKKPSHSIKSIGDTIETVLKKSKHLREIDSNKADCFMWENHKDRTDKNLPASKKIKKIGI